MSFYRLLFIFFVITLSNTLCHSKNLEVETFSYAPMDITARVNPRVDNNGENCALIKVSLPIKGCSFDNNVVETIFDVNEYLLYISPGTKELIINCPGFDKLNLNLLDYISEDIKEKCVYRLCLSGYDSNGIEEVKIDGSFVTFDIYPKNITNPSVKIDDVSQSVNGSNKISIFLPYGKHSYSIDALGYGNKTNDFIISEKSDQIIKVQLQSNVSTASFNAASNGTQIFINGQLKGYDKYKEMLSPGTYLIEAKKDGHRSYVTTITINNSCDTIINIPSLVPIYSNIRVGVSPADAQILVDGVEVGVTPMIIRDILIGHHKILVSKPGYVSYSADITLQEENPYNLEYALEKIPMISTSENNNSISHMSSNKDQYYMDFANTRVTGHEYVDLGLPSGTKWATCNIGADKPSNYGNYIAWGETKPNKKCTEKNSKTYKKIFKESIAGNRKYDPATALWGEQWQLPTKEQFQELIDNCKWETDDIDGKPGSKIIGPNGNSIFIPASGEGLGILGTIDIYRNRSLKEGDEVEWNIWLSNPCEYCRYNNLGKCSFYGRCQLTYRYGRFKDDLVSREGSFKGNLPSLEESWMRYRGYAIRPVISGN